jgi:hypothetical protein
MRGGRFSVVLLGGGGAWTLHLLLAYAIAEFGCLSGWGRQQFAGFSLVAWLLLGLSLVALTLAGGATIAAARLRRRAEQRVSEAEADRALVFGARLAFVTNLVFTVVIAVQSVPILYYLSGC